MLPLRWKLAKFMALTKKLHNPLCARYYDHLQLPDTKKELTCTQP